MKSITVFCGSSFGSDSIYKEQATLLGQTLAKQNIQLVYGGSNTGLMGAVADGSLHADGKVIEFFPASCNPKKLLINT
jgi:predicted Rossmann-fold nucleotide-binding protein